MRIWKTRSDFEGVVGFLQQLARVVPPWPSGTLALEQHEILAS